MPNDSNKSGIMDTLNIKCVLTKKFFKFMRDFMDRRVQKTKESLYESLVILMKEKDINRITVKELTEMANVNRKTFYLHYKDIFDMVDKVKEKMLDELKAVVSAHNKDIIDFSVEPLSLFMDITKFVQRNKEIMFILLSNHANADFTFVNNIKTIMKEYCINIWNTIYPDSNSKNYDYFYSFAFYGYIGLMQDWIDSGQKDDVEYIGKLAAKMFCNTEVIIRS